MRISAWLFLILMLPALQGCFPVIAIGVAGGAVIASDRRSTGTFIEDQEIEFKAAGRLSKQLKNQVHVNATSYNYVVLLTGEAPTTALKRRVAQIVRTIPNVRGIVDEISVAAPTSFSSRSHDVYLMSKVIARFVNAGKFSPVYVKVVTEDGVVYLMGLVTHQEAADAVKIARTTSGVKKVVTVFQYMNTATAQ